MTVVYVLLSFGAGYLTGRLGHWWLNPLVGNPDWAPDHWIYGVLLVAIGLYITGFVGLLLIAFGIGHFISDLKDFLNFKFIGADDDSQPPRFWGID